MKFFIDTANLDQIREAYDMGVLDGVTTNPSLMAKEGIKGVDNQRKHYVEICNIVQGEFMEAMYNIAAENPALWLQMKSLQIENYIHKLVYFVLIICFNVPRVSQLALLKKKISFPYVFYLATIYNNKE